MLEEGAFSAPGCEVLDGLHLVHALAGVAQLRPAREVVASRFAGPLDAQGELPGLGRPLKKDKDFERSLGEEVEIRLYKPREKQKEFAGVLKAYDKGTVTIETEDGREEVFTRSEIALIRLAFDF